MKNPLWAPQNSNEQLDDSTQNDITKVPDLDNPHSKKAKGKLYK